MVSRAPPVVARYDLGFQDGKVSNYKERPGRARDSENKEEARESEGVRSVTHHLEVDTEEGAEEGEKPIFMMVTYYWDYSVS